MDGHLSDLLRLSKNRKKSDSFAAHFKHHFNSTTSCTDLHKYMLLKVLKQLNPIGAMENFTKPNCNLCMKKHLTILKNLCDECVTIMNNNLEIYGACRHKTTYHWFFLSTDDPIFNGWYGYAVKWFSNIRNWTRQRLFLILNIFLKSNQLWKTKLNRTLF